MASTVLVAAVLAAAAAWLTVGHVPRRWPTRESVRSGETVESTRPWIAASPAGRTQLLVAVGAALVVLLMVPGAFGLAGALGAGAAGWRYAGRLEPASVRRRREVVEAELPHVVDLLLATVGVGASPAEALSRVIAVAHPTVAEELGALVGRLELGADPALVWRDMATHPQFGRLGRTLRRSAESGAPVVESLERLAGDLRALRRTEVEARVRQVEVRAAVPLGVCLLPAFVLIGIVPLVAGAAGSLLGAVR